MSNGLLAKPMLGDNPVVLRPYQLEAVDAVRAEFAKGVKRTAIVMATGVGKSSVAGQITRHTIEKGNRVLVLCPTRHLVSQMANTLDKMGVEPGVEMAEHRARELFDADVVVATTATMHAKRLGEWPQDYFQLIIIDECHHAICAGTKRILKHFHRARACGMTATYDRADDEHLGQIFESVAYEYNLLRATAKIDPGPYLCDLRVVECGVDIDLRGLRVKNGDYTDADLEALIGPMVDVLANAIKKEAGDLSTLVFTPMIKSAQGMATALQSLGVRADWISGADPDREKKIEKYSSGEIQMLANVSLLTEGVDLPRTAAIGLCRPTKSRPLMAQIAGRGTRLYPEKTECILIDFNYLVAKNKLVKPIELYDGGGVDQEVLDIAQDLIKKNKQLKLAEAIGEAEIEHRKQSVLRIQARERNIGYKRVSYDPLSVCDALGIPWRGSRVTDAVISRATPGQVKMLNKLGIDDAPNLSRTRASTIIDYTLSRSKAGLASPKQTSHLIAQGIPPEVARAMSKKEASEELSRIWGKN